MKTELGFFGVIIWIAGIIIAKGFWSTLFAVFLPPWGWYLVIERAMYALKMLP
jgi:uncharacterized membrane protein